jgi:hypothetical protein
MGEQLSLHVFPTVMFCLTTGPKQQAKRPQTETSETMSQTKPFLLFKLVISGILFQKQKVD